jgi:hypothetical protein
MRPGRAAPSNGCGDPGSAATLPEEAKRERAPGRGAGWRARARAARGSARARALRQVCSRLAVRLERVGLAAAAIEGKDQLTTQPLPQRVARDEARQLGDALAVMTQLEVGLDPVFERCQAQLLQSGCLGRRKRHV